MADCANGSGRCVRGRRARMTSGFLSVLALLAPVAQSHAIQGNQGLPSELGAATPRLPEAAAGSIFLDVQTPVRWREGVAIPIVVAAKSVPAKDLAVAAGPFVQAATADALQLDFCLAEKPKGPCGLQSVAANSQKAFWLIATGSAEPGSYTGTVRLLGHGGLEVNKQVTIAVTEDGWRAWGLAALIAGALLSFLLAVWMPHQRRRDLALRPFALLAERLRKVRVTLVSGEESNVSARAQALLRELTPARLNEIGLIPGRWPSSSPATDPGEQLKIHFDGVQAKVAGLEALAAAITGTRDPRQQEDLDDLAAAADFPQPDLAARINGILDPQERAGSPTVAATMPTPAELVIREEARNFLFWLASSVITVIAGYALLVDADISFGGWTDVAAVFLWGLGLSTSGTKIADLTQTQIRTAFRPA